MKLNSKLKILLYFIIIALSTYAVSLCSEEIEHNIDFQHEGDLWFLPSDMHDSLYVKIEFAESSSEMMQGLMYRESMNKDEGMLFIYQYNQEMNFWMKNTHIPLDMIFIDENGFVVDMHEHAVAFSEKNISSTVLSRFVLEVNEGFCEKNYIIIGDKIKWLKHKD